MNIENPLAYSFIMQDDIYLLDKDKLQYSEAAAADHPELLLSIKPVPVAEPEPISFKYLGGHKRNFLVIVHYNNTEFIAGPHLTALESILKRLEFGLDDVAIFNRANYSDTSFADVVDFFKPKKLLLLGKLALPAGIEPLTLNTPKQVNNCPTLFSYGFDEMMDSNERKKAFWEQMKQL